MRGADGKLCQVRRGVATELKYLGLITWLYVNCMNVDMHVLIYAFM
jgi:hypothetical protein